MIGLVGQGALQRARVPRGAPPRRPPGFVARMEEVLQLRAEQQATVRPILEVTADANQRVIDAAHVQLRAALDSMSRTLAPLLDEAQRQRLAERVRELPDPFRPPPPRDGQGPPPRGGPPPDGPPPPSP
ncbi:MAG: hypothetical protein IPP90_23765 [Gemmatimonadaceae bacterium]|nr:hypothetical protein [Gemmatimonadaceae bacterium]